MVQLPAFLFPCHARFFSPYVDCDWLETALIEGYIMAHHASQAVDDAAESHCTRGITVSVDLHGFSQMKDYQAHLTD